MPARSNGVPRKQLLMTSGQQLGMYRLDLDHANVWIGCDDQPGTAYSYGGTRMVDVEASDDVVVGILGRLLVDESQLKNRLINLALREGILDGFADRLPGGFLGSSVGGARCVIRPSTHQNAETLTSPEHAGFKPTVDGIFEQIGAVLNGEDGRIKLTPDFGRFALFADLLRQFTPHVLGIGCEVGGCGGKSSYSTTGAIAAFEACGPDHSTPVTVIGAAGAMGSQFLEYLTKRGYSDIAVADIAYAGPGVNSPDGLKALRSEHGTFTPECLGRGGVVVPFTWGCELENSDLDALAPGTKLVLAHNHAVPAGPDGVQLMRSVAERGVLALPGQVLTLGGALTSRVEWFWRESMPGIAFDKPLAHDVVRAVVGHWVRRCLEVAAMDMTTPHEAMLRLAELPEMATADH